MNTPGPVRRTFGCRSPYSKGKGYWDGVLIYFESMVKRHTIIIFEDESINVVFPKDIDQCIQLYRKKEEIGWYPMEPDDIELTIGIVIDASTNVSKVPSSRRTRFCVIS